MAEALTFSGRSSQLNVQYFPAIDLSDGDYVCGLVDFQTFNSIPNIDETNNLFYFGYENPLHDELRTNEIGDNDGSGGDGNGGDGDNHELLKFESFVDDGGAASDSNDIPEYTIEQPPSNEQMGEHQQQQQSETATKRLRRAAIVRRKNPIKRRNQPLTCIQIPTGSYEVADLYNYLKKVLYRHGVGFMLKANKNTLQCEMMCSQPIDFEKPNTIGALLGFRHGQILNKNTVHVSELPADILKVNVIRIECGIIKGAYFNNAPSHTIHEFSSRVAPGYKIIEVPQNVIYFPVTVKHVHSISLSVVDEQNRLINFRGETITIRLHIKKVT